MRPDAGRVLALCVALTDAVGRMARALALTLVYLVVIIPTSLILRLTGPRLLDPGPDPELPSYWSEREQRPTPSESWRRQW